jgi:glutaryl-CoA dehydrogenase
MITNFKDMGDHYLLNGAKCGFQCPLADIAGLGKKTKEGRIHGLIVERGMEGFLHRNLKNGHSVHHRQGINFDNVKYLKKICYQTNGLGAPLGCLDSAHTELLGSYRCCHGLL